MLFQLYMVVGAKPVTHEKVLCGEWLLVVSDALDGPRVHRGTREKHLHHVREERG